MGKEMELYNLWLREVGENETFRKELEAIANDVDEIRDRFYRDIDFGTAGLRGVLGLGTNRMNIYTVRRAAQGLATYLCSKIQYPTAAIAYDSRNLSDVFARETACVLAANGIDVHLYEELMPTPALSYAVRELGCDAGVVITASHNPAQYNGFKAYGNDGCQIGPEIADAVMKNIMDTDLFSGVRCMDFEQALEQGRICCIPDAFTEQYIDRVFEEAIQPEVCEKAGLRLVYTPLNGAGNRCVRSILKKAGVKDITVVPEQEHPDGNFPTCPYPNPEMREALELGLALSEKIDADMLLATDPDADRVAVAVKNPKGGYRILSGNEAGVLLLDYIARARTATGTMPKNPVAVRSIVTTKLSDEVAKEYGIELHSVLTGFKFIGEVILGLEEKGEKDRFILGFEESCGYLTGPYVRDKDAISASLLFVEMASAWKLEGQTLLDRLDSIYKKHGIFRNHVESYAFEGADGMKKMAQIMQDLRNNPPSELAGEAVVARTDYQISQRVEGGKITSIALPKSNVLEFEMEDGSSVIVRPSGTEPKIKLYYSVLGTQQNTVERKLSLYESACTQLIGL